MIAIVEGTLLGPVKGRPGCAGYAPPPPSLDVQRAFARFGVYVDVLDMCGDARWRMKVGTADTDAAGRIALRFEPPFASVLPRAVALEFEVESCGVPLEEAA